MESRYVFLGATIKSNITETEPDMGNRIYSSTIAGYTYHTYPLIRFELDSTKGKKYLQTTEAVCNETIEDNLFETVIATTTSITSDVYTQPTFPQETVSDWTKKATVSGIIIDILSDDRGTLATKFPTFLGNYSSKGYRVYRRDSDTEFVKADIGLTASGIGGTIFIPRILDLEATL